VANPSLPPVDVEVPFDPITETAVLKAQRLADQFGQFEVTPAHLFLALLEQPDDAVDGCLRLVGIDLAGTTEAVARFAQGAA
jgi:ATP-dependent Clp protease ATP-binding subunit ClpA